MAEPTKRAGSARAGAAKTAAAKKAPAKRTAPAKAAPAAPPAPPPASPTTRSEPLAASGSTWSIAYKATAVVLVLAAFVLMLKMADQERGGPAHGDVHFGDGIPATLYLPVDAEDDGELPVPPPKGERPPVIVMSHGYSVDRASMSGMARSLARAGYAVLSIDLRGHGANTHAFQGDLRDDLDAAVDWATTSPYVDGERLAVLGHSMGASAVLGFATVDERPDAVIPVSGGSELNDAVVPEHTLFLVASGDPGDIHDRQEELAEDLAALGGKVTSKEISGRDHITVLRADDTITSIVEFLDPILGVERDGPSPGLDDPRMKTATLYLVVVLGLIALLGLAMGQAFPVPTVTGRRPGATWWAFAVPAGALVLTMPLLSIGGFDLLPLGAGQQIVMHFALAAALLWGARALARRGQVQGDLGAWLADGQWLQLRGAAPAALASAGIIVALLLPMAGVFHRMVPTAERAVYWVVLSVVAAPFFVAFEALVRRGTTVRGNVLGVVGKVMLLLLLFAGVGVGMLPGVLGLIATLLVLQYVLLETFAGTVYARGRNTTLIGLTEAILIGYVAVTLTPVA